MFLDGGMLTGSAYMREPWGVSRIYSIDDPNYRGVLFIPRERLLPFVRAAVESGLQFTAHSVGDGAVHTLLSVYDELSKEGLPVRKTRGCVTHSNFMSQEGVEGTYGYYEAVDYTRERMRSASPSPLSLPPLTRSHPVKTPGTRPHPAPPRVSPPPALCPHSTAAHSGPNSRSPASSRRARTPAR